MADVFSKRKRSEVMSRIRGRGNKDTELALAKLFRANEISGWRRHVVVRGRAVLPRGPNFKAAQQRRPTLPKTGALGGPSRTGKPHPAKDRTAQRSVPTFRVKPDFVFIKLKLAIFVDGCFWHGCPKHATKPKNNRAFWNRKLSGNKQRDRSVNVELRRAGWRVIRIWECDLAKRPQFCVKRILRALH